MMTFSPLVTRTISTRNQGPRVGNPRIDTMILHHAASANFEGVLSMIANATRQVSYNYLISSAGQIAGVVPENLRSWSVAHQGWDSRSITICCINERVGEPWPISAAAAEACAQLVADVGRRVGVPLNRNRVFGHRELFTWHGAGYPTACPGPLPMNDVVNRAVQINNTPQQQERKHTMAVIRATETGGIFLFSVGYVKHLADIGEVQAALRTERLGTWDDFDRLDFQRSIWNYGLEEYSVDQVLALANPAGRFLVASWLRTNPVNYQRIGQLINEALDERS
jgi:hypothetical protein